MTEFKTHKHALADALISIECDEPEKADIDAYLYEAKEITDRLRNRGYLVVPILPTEINNG